MSTREKSFPLDVGPHTLAATLIEPETLIPGVLFVHGWGGSQKGYAARARQIASLGCICLSFDLTGHADTVSQHTTVSRQENFRDVTAAYDYLVSRPGVDPNAMFVVGSSYGGYLAAILTTVRPVRWLALRVPALYYDDGWELPKLRLHKDWDLVSYRRRVVAPGDNRVLQACSDFRGDVLLVESEFDEIVPHPVLQSYQEACAPCHSLTFRVIKGADHGLSKPEHQLRYTNILEAWIEEMLASAREIPVEPPEGAPTPPEVPPKTE